MTYQFKGTERTQYYVASIWLIFLFFFTQFQWANIQIILQFSWLGSLFKGYYIFIHSIFTLLFTSN